MSEESDRAAKLNALHGKHFSELVEALIDPNVPLIYVGNVPPGELMPLPDRYKSGRGRTRNSDRDIFIFNEVQRGIEGKKILAGVNSVLGWSRLTGPDGLRKAYLRYCKAREIVPSSRK